MTPTEIMKQRVIAGTPTITYNLQYDAENRLKKVYTTDVNNPLAEFWYDGDGQRVKAVMDGTPNDTVIAYPSTTLRPSVGNYYEYQTVGSTVTTRRYYYAGGQRACPECNRRVALRENSTLYWLSIIQ